MTGRAARHYSQVAIRGSCKRRGGLVARLARGGGREVVRRFAHDPGVAAAMTGHTAGRDPLVVHGRPRPKGLRRLMTRLAPHRGWNMGRRFAQRRGPVMTGRTTRHYSRVIIRSPHKRGRRFVTVLTGGARRDVRDRKSVV